MNFVYLIILIFLTNTTNCARDVVEFNHIASLCKIWVKTNINARFLYIIAFNIILILILYIKLIKYIDKKFKSESEKILTDQAKSTIDELVKSGYALKVIDNIQNKLINDKDFVKKVLENKELIEALNKALSDALLKNSNMIVDTNIEKVKQTIDSFCNKLNPETNKFGLFKGSKVFSEEEIGLLYNTMLHYALQTPTIIPGGVLTPQRNNKT